MTLDDQVLARPTTPASGADVRSIFSQLKPSAAEPRRIALVGTYAPRKCGIATFTTDMFEQLAEFHPDIRVDVYALDDPTTPLAYEGVAGTIASDDPAAYARGRAPDQRERRRRGLAPARIRHLRRRPTARWCATSSTGSPRR